MGYSAAFCDKWTMLMGGFGDELGGLTYFNTGEVIQRRNVFIIFAANLTINYTKL